MFELLLVATAFVLASGVLVAYSSTRDVLNPMTFFGPLFFFGTVVDPWMVRSQLDRFFQSPADLTMVLLLNLFAVLALVTGAVRRISRGTSRPFRQVSISGHEAVILRRVGWVLAGWGLVAYSFSLANAGGFVAAYSQAKGGGYASSGYLSEGMNLTLVAAAMSALSRFRRGWTSSSLMLCLLGLLPNLLQGTFGGRRGPLFLALAAAILSWFVTRRRLPKMWMVWPALGAAALAVAFVGSQRRYLHLGTDEGVQWEEFTQDLTHENVDQGNNFIYGAGFVLATRHAAHYTWGREFAVNLLVRPVPRQIWPTKYEDVGATWITNNYPGLGHLTPVDWLEAVGWLPLAGSSGISISDVFGEFSWGTVLVFYLIGRGFAELYRRRRESGMWELLYLEALILSIYLATQSFSAFYHRYLILAVPTVLAWRIFVKSRTRLNRRVRVLRRPVPRPSSTPA